MRNVSYFLLYEIMMKKEVDLEYVFRMYIKNANNEDLNYFIYSFIFLLANYIAPKSNNYH